MVHERNKNLCLLRNATSQEFGENVGKCFQEVSKVDDKNDDEKIKLICDPKKESGKWRGARRHLSGRVKITPGECILRVTCTCVNG